MQEEKQVFRTLLWVATVFSLFVIVSATVALFSRSAVKATHGKDAALVYEEFQEIYHTCEQINRDLCMVRSLNDQDALFTLVSKAQRIYSLQLRLSNWIKEYNAKSSMWGRSLWKSNKLPFELSINQFPCYSSPQTQQ